MGDPYKQPQIHSSKYNPKVYTSVGSNHSKLNTSKGDTAAASTKRSKVNIKKSNNGLMPRGNTLDNRYGACI